MTRHPTLDAIRQLDTAARELGAKVVRVAVTADAGVRAIDTRPVAGAQLWTDALELEVRVHPIDWQDLEQFLGVAIREVYGHPVLRIGSN